MKLKLTLVYVLSFLALTFFIHELHDWAHTVMARIVNGCWGPRGFDIWGFCVDYRVSPGQRILSVMAGPLVNFILLWIGWQKMDERNTPQEQSVGCSLVLATLPLNNLLAAVAGGGDLTLACRLLLPHANHRIMALVGLVLMVILCVPPLVRTFVALPWWKGRLFFYPVFLIAPGYLDHWFVGKMLNQWFIKPGTPQMTAYWWVLGWTALTGLILVLTFRKLKQVISDEELPL